MPAEMQGLLRVLLCRAVELQVVQKRGIQDPYCELKIGTGKAKSAVHTDGGVSPVWNQEFLFDSVTPNDELKIKIMDKNVLVDAKIGSCALPLAKVLEQCLGGEVHLFLPVVRADGRSYQGQLEVKLQFTPHKGQLPQPRLPHPGVSQAQSSGGVGSAAPPGLSPALYDSASSYPQAAASQLQISTGNGQAGTGVRPNHQDGQVASHADRLAGFAPNTSGMYDQYGVPSAAATQQQQQQQYEYLPPPAAVNQMQSHGAVPALNGGQGRALGGVASARPGHSRTSTASMDEPHAPLGTAHELQQQRGAAHDRPSPRAAGYQQQQQRSAVNGRQWQAGQGYERQLPEDAAYDAAYDQPSPAHRSDRASPTAALAAGAYNGSSPAGYDRPSPSGYGRASPRGQNTQPAGATGGYARRSDDGAYGRPAGAAAVAAAGGYDRPSRSSYDSPVAAAAGGYDRPSPRGVDHLSPTSSHDRHLDASGYDRPSPRGYDGISPTSSQQSLGSQQSQGSQPLARLSGAGASQQGAPGYQPHPQGRLSTSGSSQTGAPRPPRVPQQASTYDHAPQQQQQQQQQQQGAGARGSGYDRASPRSSAGGYDNAAYGQPAHGQGGYHDRPSAGRSGAGDYARGAGTAAGPSPRGYAGANTPSGGAQRQQHQQQHQQQQRDAWQAGPVPPTPAVGATPRSRAQDWILRPPYCGRDCAAEYQDWAVIGQGHYATTYRAIKKGTHRAYAIKAISKRRLGREEERQAVVREIQMLKKMEGHPHVVKLYDVWETRQEVCLCMELCSGGELFEAIVERGHYSERSAAMIMRTIIGVVADMHTRGIMHRDLKPENFLFSDKTHTAVIKTADFGCATQFQRGVMLREVVGSTQYVAPEVLAGSYGPEADLWSCGCCLYALLSGTTPYLANSAQDLVYLINTQPLDLRSHPWSTISGPAKDCVRRLLVVDPARRATAADILQHEWLREGGVASDAPLVLEVLERLKKFCRMNKLKKQALKVIAAGLPLHDVAELRQLFIDIDVDRSGTISVEEFTEALKRKGQALRRADVESLMAAADLDGDQQLDYEEFVAVMMNHAKLQQEENLKKAFEHFDLDGNGKISRRELYQCLQQQGLDQADIPRIISEVDRDGDGQIDYQEFCLMLRRM